MDAVDRLQIKLNEICQTNARLKILEAGCGSIAHLNFGSAYLAGIDISQKQLDRNSYLKEKIRGDIQFFDLTGYNFDVIVCWDVLEHLSYPQKTLDNLLNGLRPGGILVVAAPNPLSFWGLATKFTPNFLHTAFYKYILGSKKAGKEDLGPFKTFMRFSMRPENIIKFAEKGKYDVLYIDIYEGHLQKIIRQKYKLIDLWFRFLSRFSSKLNNCSFIIIIQKSKLPYRSTPGATTKNLHLRGGSKQCGNIL